MTARGKNRNQHGTAQGRGPEALSLRERELVAGELRHWVRLTSRCNNRCIFCLDSPVQDGSVRSMADVRLDLEQGRQRGAGRVVLSGGEPTIHPKFVGIMSLARSLGYDWIQVVTNGRMFAYRSFVEDCVAAGLSEATVSMPAADPGMFARLTGTARAFEQAMAGLGNLLASERLVVSVDIVVSQVNLASLPDVVGFYLDMGVREFDLLQVVPFGRAFEFKDQLFFEPNQEASGLVCRAIDLARRRGAVVWTNRMDPRLLEGMEEYIQDPHKIGDEVYGRRGHLAAFAAGADMPCDHPDRCPHCFLNGYCDHLRRVRDTLASQGDRGKQPKGPGLWLRCEPQTLERAATLFSRPGPEIGRRVRGIWPSVCLDVPLSNDNQVESALAAGVASAWSLSLSGRERSPSASSSALRLKALSSWLQTLLDVGVERSLHSLKLDFDMTRHEADLVVAWYRDRLGLGWAGQTPTTSSDDVGWNPGPAAEENPRGKPTRSSPPGRSAPVLVLTMGLVPVPIAIWMQDRLPVGIVRMAFPEVGSVAELDRLEVLGRDPLEWLERWRQETRSARMKQRLGGPGFQDVPPCLVPGAPVTRGPLWLSVGAVDDQGRILPDRLVEDYVRQAYRVWSGRCDQCPARDRCPGLPIHIARKYGLGILNPSSVES